MASKSVKKIDIGMDDGIIDLKAKERGLGGFKVKKIEEDEYDDQSETASIEYLTAQMEQNARLSPSMQYLENLEQLNPKDFIKVKFSKFVQLVSSRDYMEILERNKDENIILSSNLLTELAGSIDEKSEKRVPVIFLVGLAIGIVLTYILINK